jgi:RNA polymerase sigma-70 factor (ECF subfamily)
LAIGTGADESGTQHGNPLGPQQEQLDDRLRRRDPEAFEEFYRLLHPRLAHFVVGLTKRADLAEDVINETMLAAWRGLPQFKGESKLSTWVFAIAYRIAIRVAKRHDRPVGEEDMPEVVDEYALTDGDAESAQRQRLLQAAIAELSADHRMVVELTYYQDMGYREIAEIMDCPVDTIKTRMFHARRYLKAKLAGDKSDWL